MSDQEPSCQEPKRKRIDPKWFMEQVGKTNHKDTKEVKYGRKFTAIQPYSQIKKATELLGLHGYWGLFDKRYEHKKSWTMATKSREPKEVEVLILHADFIYEDGDQFIRFPMSTDMVYYAGEDCYKKIQTDLLTKAMSMICFNLDVFLGQWDDVKYVQEQRQAEKAKEAIPSKPTPRAEPKPESELSKAKKALQAAVQAKMDEQGCKDGNAIRIIQETIAAIWGERRALESIEDVLRVRKRIERLDLTDGRLAIQLAIFLKFADLKDEAKAEVLKRCGLSEINDIAPLSVDVLRDVAAVIKEYSS